MFTTIMYSVINEVTRQPVSAGMAPMVQRHDSTGQAMARSRRRIQHVVAASRAHTPLPGTYRVLADSFKCAAGFH